MAVIPIAQCQVLYNQGGTDLIALIALRDCQTGDTIDVTTLPIGPEFTFIRQAIVLSFSANQSAKCSVSGTVVTLPSGLPPNSSMYLFVGGC